MKKLKLAIIILWYFAAVSYSGTLVPVATTIGPFDTKADCDAIRNWLVEKKANFYVTSCWSVKKGAKDAG